MITIKKWIMFILVFLILTGCRSTPFDGGVIDWVDFIKWNGQEYNRIHSGVLADNRYVVDKIGTVKYKVADNVTNPKYKTRNGDAAFLEKGTEIFKIKDHPSLIAVKSTHSINGYKVYFSRDDTEYRWNFKDMPVEKVKKIEIYQTDTPEKNKLISELGDKEEVKSFLQVLMNNETDPDFRPNTENRDPIFYEMVFYTGEPIAYKYHLQFDGYTYLWHPDHTSILSDEIKEFIRQ